MGTQHTTSQKLRSIIIAAFATLALAVLFAKLDESVSHLTNLLCASEWVALELVPRFVVAATHSFAANAFGQLVTSSCPLQMLASHLPLHVLLGLA